MKINENRGFQDRKLLIGARLPSNPPPNLRGNEALSLVPSETPQINENHRKSSKSMEFNEI